MVLDGDDCELNFDEMLVMELGDRKTIGFDDF